MRIALVQYDIAWEEKPANHAAIERMLDAAAVRPGTFVILPELGDTGFSMNLRAIADLRSLEWAQRTARQRGLWLQHGFARIEAAARPPGRNCAAIISPAGEVIALYEKIHPFSYGKESAHYSGGSHLAIAKVGDARTAANCAEVCPLICYDLRFPELWRLAVAAPDRTPAEVFTLGASWPAARQHHWRALCLARAIENQAFVLAVNRCGRDPYLAYAGGSLIVSPRGEIIAEAGPEPTVLQADIDPADVRAWRAEFPALADIRRSFLGSVPVQ